MEKPLIATRGKKETKSVELITVREVCNLIGYSESGIRRIMRTQLIVYKIGSRSYISKSQVFARFATLSAANKEKIGGRSRLRINISGTLES